MSKFEDIIKKYHQVDREGRISVWNPKAASLEIESHVAAEVAEAVQLGVADELDAVRRRYDEMELQNSIDTMESGHVHRFVTWRGWKMIRNVITDRIEELTGRRDYRATPPTSDQGGETASPSAYPDTKHTDAIHMPTGFLDLPDDEQARLLGDAAEAANREQKAFLDAPAPDSAAEVCQVCGQREVRGSEQNHIVAGRHNQAHH